MTGSAGSWPARPNGYTLLELILSLASATLLLAGLVSAIFITARGLDGTSRAALRARAAEVQADMLVDLGQATRFRQRSDTEVTFDVPDRDGDGNDETVRYAWQPKTGELQMSWNGGPSATLLEGVTDFRFRYGTRSISGNAQTPEPFDPDDWGTRWMAAHGAVVFEEFSEARLSSNGKALAIAIPPGTSAGDLLIAAVAIDSSEDPEIPSGWNVLRVDKVLAGVTLAVCWKVAGDSEPSSVLFEWSSSEQAYGWVMRFTGHDPDSPIHAVASASGIGLLSPTCRDVDTTIDNVLILRLGAFDDDDINVDDPGLENHVAITMDASNSGNGTVSGGAGYFTMSVAGNTGTATFDLTASEQYVTTTIAIAPDPNR